MTSTPTTTDVVLSAALSVEPASNGSARRSEPSVDMKFAGALSGTIHAFEIPADEHRGQTASGSIRNVDAKIAELLGVRLSSVEVDDLAVHPISNEIYISVTQIESFASQPASVKISVDHDISLLETSSLAFQKQELIEFPGVNATFQVRGAGGGGPLPRDMAKGAVSVRSLAIMDLEYCDGERATSCTPARPPSSFEPKSQCGRRVSACVCDFKGGD